MTKFLLTMQYEEKFLLPFFIKHYSQFFPLNFIYVIDHGSSENFIPDGVNRIYIPRDRDFSEIDRMMLIKNIADGLLKYYDYGVYADCDEFIALDYFDERELSNYPVSYVCGFDCFSGVIDGAAKVYGLINPVMCKPLIFKEVPNWNSGFHFSDGHPPSLELSIPMAHVRYLFKSEISRRVNIRKTVYSSLAPREKAAGFDLHWSAGEKAASDFFEYLDRLIEKNPQISSFHNFKRNQLFNEHFTTGVYTSRSVFMGKGGYELFEERFDLTDFFPALLEK